MNPLLPVIVVLLIVIIGLIYYAMYLLDARERLLRRLESTVKGKLYASNQNRTTFAALAHVDRSIPSKAS